MKFGKALSGLSDRADSFHDGFKRDLHYAKSALDKNQTMGERINNAAHTIFRNDKDKGIDNFYTGYGLSTSAKTAVVGAGLVYGLDKAFSVPEDIKESARKNMEEYEKNKEEVQYESLVGTRADGQGYQLGTNQMIQNVQAQGDLVFALNQTRQGGFL